MTIMRSVRSINGGLVFFGSPSIHPVTPGVTTPGFVGVTVPPYQSIIPDTSSDIQTSTSVITTPTSVQTITNNLSLPGFILAGRNAHGSPVQPTYALPLWAASGNHKRASDLASATVKKFKPYELLTGISQERPELIMMTNFVPLYDFNSSPIKKTAAGEFFDVQVNTRNLKFTNSSQLIQSLQNTWPQFQDLMSARQHAFQDNLFAMKEMTNFLITTVHSLEQLKSQLDLRNQVHTISPRDILVRNTRQANEPKPTGSHNENTNVINLIPSSYTWTDALVRFGYSPGNIKQTFLSTKMWMQLLYELKNVLLYHSLEFAGIETVQQNIDKNSAMITRSNVDYFDFASNIPDLPTVKELINLQITEAVKLGSTTKTVRTAFEQLYVNVHFKTEEMRMANLANLISREFRYSNALSDSDTVTALKNDFGYTVETNGNDNSQLFDSVIGTFGKNISDIADPISTSLVSLSQFKTTDSVVLTFESKYIEGDTGTLTPGAEYYVEQLLQPISDKSATGVKFDTTRVVDLINRMNTTKKSYSNIRTKLNLLQQTSTQQTDRSEQKFESTLSNSEEFLNLLLKSIINDAGDTFNDVYAKQDRMASIYTLAAGDVSVKTTLFLYTMTKISRSYSNNVPYFSSSPGADNTVLTDNLIKKLCQDLDFSSPKTVTSLQLINEKRKSGTTSTDTWTHDAVMTSMKNGTYLTTFVEDTMSKVLSSFADHCLLHDRTRYGGFLDTIVMMAAFDLIISLIAKYGNQHIVGINRQDRTPSYTIETTTLNNLDSKNDLTSRARRELAIVYQSLFSVESSIQTLINSMQAYVNNLESPEALGKLNKLATVVSDNDLLKMLMSEQQIMIMASNIDDMYDRISLNVVPADLELSANNNFSADDLKLLDDAIATPVMRNAIDSFFSFSQFSTKKAFNKKILSVGVPLGLSNVLKQKFNISSMSTSVAKQKQNDIINIVVYKVDLENGDIIYKPQRFTFELSRFPVRNDARFLPLSQGTPGISSIVNALPTRDYGQSIDPGTSTIDYAGVTQAVPDGYSTAMADDTYDFLTPLQKQAILQNHVTSYMLEAYVKFMTGITLNEFNFSVVPHATLMEQSFIKTLIKYAVASVTNTPAPVTNTRQDSGSSFFPSLQSIQIGGNISLTSQLRGIIGDNVIKTIEQQQPSGDLDTLLSKLSIDDVAYVVQQLTNIGNVSKMVTPMSDPDLLQRKTMLPKQFDRIFNVIIDPDDFEIDYNKTIGTPLGVKAFDQMLTNGRIIADDQHYPRDPITNGLENIFLPFATAANPGFAPAIAARGFASNTVNPNLYKFHDRDKNEGDFIFEKYFISIETFGEEEV
jgi:hypothetical protein